MKKDMICIICPRGCSLEVDINGGDVAVKGNACSKGEEYAKKECISPTRTLTSIVRVENRIDTMLSVKTETPIPKEKIFDAMQLIKTKTVLAPIKIGDVIIEELFGSRLIATMDVE